MMSIKYYATCDCCNFSALSKTHWSVHINTQKHQRNGKKRSELNICDKCGYWCMYHYNMEIHKIVKHGTTEQKKTAPKYCEYCDMAFFSDLFHKKHLMSKKHKTNQSIYKNISSESEEKLNYMIYINELETKINSSLFALNINLSNYSKNIDI